MSLYPAGRKLAEKGRWKMMGSTDEAGGASSPNRDLGWEGTQALQTALPSIAAGRGRTPDTPLREGWSHTCST